MLGYDRLTHAFFQFLVNGSPEYVPGAAIKSLDDLRAGVDRARQLSLLFFGNVKFGFKKLARNADEFHLYYSSTLPLNPDTLKQRHDPILPVDPIDPNETYYLGYVVQKEIEAALRTNPDDPAALASKQVLERVRHAGIRNHNAYLISDHLDVYVATSMRRRHEYLEVAEITGSVFRQKKLHDLKLRWFDPTQAYCADRVDKGLAEALMLKRAKCTLYLAQESDTLGRLELASTLAQGKPVIAYVPSPSGAQVRQSVERLSALYSKDNSATILERIQALVPNAPGKTLRFVAGWITRLNSMLRRAFGCSSMSLTSIIARGLRP